jgi:hypothetical protein
MSAVADRHHGIQAPTTVRSRAKASAVFPRSQM